MEKRTVSLFVFAGMSFVAFGLLIQIGVIELESGDAILNIIGGLILLALIPFIAKKRK